MFQKLAVIKRKLLQKSLWCTSFYKIVVLRCTADSFIKNEIYIRPFWKCTWNSEVFAGKPPWSMLLFSKVSGLEYIPTISSKTNSAIDICRHWFYHKALFKISESFLRTIFAIPFLTELKACAFTKGFVFNENDAFRTYSIYLTNFNSKEDLNFLKLQHALLQLSLTKRSTLFKQTLFTSYLRQATTTIKKNMERNF